MSKINSISFEITAKTALLLSILWAYTTLSAQALDTSSIEANLNQRPVKALEETRPQSSETQEGPEDFLTHESPLSKPVDENTEQVITFTEIQGKGKECSSAGSSAQGSQSCLVRNEDGSFAEVEANWESFGEESKKQIVTKNYNANGDQVSEETIRIKTEHKTLADGSREIEKESIDIVKQPLQGKVTRDLIVRNYEKNQLKKVTWAHYIENPDVGTLKASLAHHAVLYYESGKLNAGFANQYKNGRVADTLLNYNPKKNPNLRIEMTGITKWANWIDQLVNQNSVSTR